jgi:hypothetical protein
LSCSSGITTVRGEYDDEKNQPSSFSTAFHLNTNYANGKIFNRLRGAGALHDWMEWGMTITVLNPKNAKED